MTSDPLIWSVPGYRVGSLVGQGAFGEVWSGIDIVSGEAVALKRLPATTVGDRDRATSEAAALASLQHPHLVALRRFVPLRDSVVLVLELASGGSLADLIRRRDRLTPAEVSECVAPVASALAYLHDQGITHGDVSAANILFSREGRAKLGDLGMARLLCASSVRGALGTPAYVDPVVAAGGVPGLATDVFCLAAVAFHALTGSAPWSPAGTDVAAVLGLAATGRIPHLGQLEDVCPPAMARAIRRALEHDPARRGTAAEFALDVRASIDPRPVALAAGRVAVPASWSVPSDASEREVIGRVRGPQNAVLDRVPLDLTNVARVARPRFVPDGTPPPRRSRWAMDLARPALSGPRKTTVRVGAACAVLACVVVGVVVAMAATGRRAVAQAAAAPATAAAHSTATASAVQAVPVPSVEETLIALATRREGAYATRDASVLRSIYSSPRLADADVSQMAGRVPMGCGLMSLRTDYRDVRISARGAGRTTVTAVVSVSPAVLRCPGRPDVRVRGTSRRSMSIVVQQQPDGSATIASMHYA